VQKTERVAPVSISALTNPISFFVKKSGKRINKLTAPIKNPITIKKEDWMLCF
jgi:hypothetical protein